jgi:hypothetical protein
MSDYLKNFDLIDNDDLRAAIRRFSVFLRDDYVRLDSRVNAADPEQRMSTYHARSTDAWVPDVPGKNVVRMLHIGNQKSSYCFIVLRDFEKGGKQWKKGDILMAAGYKAPAFNKARGNVMENDYGNATWAGPGYLR